MAEAQELPGRVEGYKFQNSLANVTFTPEAYFEPATPEDIQQILANAACNKKKVRVMGGGLSLTPLTQTPDVLISLKKLNKVLEVDVEKRQVKAEAGITLTELNQQLAEANLAVPTEPFAQEGTLGGVLTVGAYGPATKYGGISSLVTEMEVMTGDGEILTVSREKDEELFLAVGVGLGVCGVILSATLQVEPAFNISLTQTALPLQQVLENLDSMVSEADYLQVAWFPYTDGCTIWQGNKTNDPPKFPKQSVFWDDIVGKKLQEFLLWSSSGIPSLMPSVSSFYYKHLFSEKKEMVLPSHVYFQFEGFVADILLYALPRDKFNEAFVALKSWIDTHSDCKVSFPILMRFEKSEDFYMSPAHERDTGWLEIIMQRPYGKQLPHEEYFKAVEDIMKSLNGRPHWAAMHSMSIDDVKQRYPKLDKFNEVRRRLDPEGMFLSDYMEKLLGK